jgi:spermidine dehydrogenase
MGWSEADKRLGMDRGITRRDFLDGVALAIGATALGGWGTRPAMAQTAAYPPAGEGLRGQTDAAQNVMHAIRDGSFWASNPAITDTGEVYDLVVVGAGISGLAAAFTYRQQKPGAKVLLIDPLEDFGGHAKRNEFTSSSGKRLIGYGGSQSMQTPSYFSPAVNATLAAIGIETSKFETYYNQAWAEERGLNSAVFFDAAKWGVDKLVVQSGETKDWVAQTPLNEKAKADLIALIDAPGDYLPGMTPEARLEKLAQITYKEFLLDYVKADPQLVDYFQTSTTGYFGVGIDATTALDARGNWNPGFDGMDLGESVSKYHSPSGRLGFTDPDPYIYHFPDGNAGIARHLVRALIPTAMPGSSMEDQVVAMVDYAALDKPENEVRLRLNATVVKVAHDSDPARADSVTVTYAGARGLQSVKAGHVVLACWHRVIPYLTDELAPEGPSDLHKCPIAELEGAG